MVCERKQCASGDRTEVGGVVTQQPPKSKTCKRSGCLHRIKYVQKNKEKDSGNMEGAPAKGVLSHLSLLEVKARSRKTQLQQQSRVMELKAKVEALKTQREQLKAQIQTHQDLQKLRLAMDKQCADEEEENMEEESENSKLLRLMARHTQLKDLLHAHHLIGGYDIIKTRKGKGACVSIATAYEDVFLDTFNLEIDLKPTVKISRHNIPPFIPLNNLAEQNNMQTDLRVFLDTLSKHLNAFAGRKQQLKLVKEKHKSVEVMESNVLCSLLVLLFTVPREKTAVLCTLDYTDHTRCLPTRVHLESEDKQLPDSPQWKKNCTLLMETPVHKALITMKKMGSIA
ncbi:centromere protein O isoform X3 [Pundamilia nyererei]|uniref:Centromere protein O n=1 Tax=Pundamilia nyererei TaxID=303518 RepID=A0A9Y3RHV9_9CICH|nr:PREDICTED: centromere protein O isoform X3 [Pundamilia nyererei]